MIESPRRDDSVRPSPVVLSRLEGEFSGMQHISMSVSVSLSVTVSVSVSVTVTVVVCVVACVILCVLG